MARSRKLVHGLCKLRLIELLDDSTCDYFVSKRKSRYRVCCRNCRNFEPNKKISEKIPKTDSKDS